jgi:DNA mismatch repair ATPase MutS
MAATMRNLNLLPLDEKVTANDVILEDFCFDNIRKAVFADNEELCSSFCETLKKPSDNIEVILERRRILEDFITYPNLAEDISALCDDAKMYKINHQRSVINRPRPEDKLEKIMENTVFLIKVMERLNNLLTSKPFRSKTFSIIRREPFAELISKLENLCDISSERFSYNIEFSSGFKLKSATVVNTDYTKSARKQDISFDGISMTKYIMDEIKNITVSNLCSAVSQIHSQIQSFFKELKKQVSFYIAALKLLRYLEVNGLKHCFPEFTDELSYGISAKGLYDLSLAAFNEAKNITTNDFDCRDGSIFIITGLNQGGKTTFLRSIGIAQLLAQAGLIVPAEEYRCSCFKGILTHFPKEEDRNMDFGKLAEELTRLRSGFPIITGGGLALFNESFSTTTPREGAEIAADVLRALSLTGSTVFFVTHLYELATKLDALNTSLPNGSRAVSLITEPDKNSTEARTYKIVRGEPLEEIYVSYKF